MSSYRGYITSAKKFWAKGRKKLKDVRDLDGFFEKSVSQQISLLYKMAEVETVEEQVTSLCSQRAPEVSKIKKQLFLIRKRIDSIK